MSDREIKRGLILDQIKKEVVSGSVEGQESIQEIREQFPALSEDDAKDIFNMVADALRQSGNDEVSLVVTAPAAFDIAARRTGSVMEEMLDQAHMSILVTSYAMSDYFTDLMDLIIKKSEQGVAVKFFLNDIDDRDRFNVLISHQGPFLRIYNYQKKNDPLSALHAKVISVDGRDTLITSANLSFHGQKGNIEVGARIISQDIGKQIDDLFNTLVEKNEFVEIL